MDWIAQLGLAVTTAGVASWITVNLSLARFYRERWWEKRYEAYSTAIEAAHDLHTVLTRLKAKQLDPDATRDFEAPSATDVHAPLDRLAKALAFGGLLLSREMTEVLVQLGSRLDQAGTDVDKAIAVAADLTMRANQIARKDLGLPSYR